MEKELRRAAIYGRYSSHLQKDTSIEQQFTEIRKYCRDNDIYIVSEYADRGISGTTDERPEFQRMIKDSAKGKFNFVVVWKVDRFARNRYDSAMYKAKLKKNGIKVLYAKESIPDGPEGILLESILEGSAEYYSANLAQNIKRGMEANARECKITNGSLPLGYRKSSDMRYEIDPVGAEIVRKIYNMYSEGISTVNICAALNAQGYKTKKGTPFNKNSLRKILSNERYTGVYIYGDMRIEGGVPAIIDKELFEKAGKMMEYHAKSPAASVDFQYLLTGKLFCGHCGEPMIGMSGTGKSGNKFAYYSCANKRRGDKSCTKKNVAKDEIESEVVKRTMQYVLQDDIIENISQAAVDLQERERDTSVLDGLKAKLRETESALNNIVKAIEKGIFNDTTAARMQQLEDDKKDLKNLIADAEIEQPMLTKDQVSFFLHKMKKGDPNSIEFQERIIDIFITAIYLYDDNRLKIVYTYNHESQDYELPSDSTENENEAEALAYNGKCSTSSMLVETRAQSANTTLEITTRYIILTSYLHSAFSVL